jgi:hypothetical protein
MVIMFNISSWNPKSVILRSFRKTESMIIIFNIGQKRWLASAASGGGLAMAEPQLAPLMSRVHAGGNKIHVKVFQGYQCKI